jgi:hypothetical protein
VPFGSLYAGISLQFDEGPCQVTKKRIKISVVLVLTGSGT